MDGTPHLLTDVKFSERRRGYDPDEVDNFLAQVSTKVAQLQDMVRAATARADEAEAKVADARRAQSGAEAQLEQAQAELAARAGAPRDEAAEVEQASKILLMAQKTADATVEEAERTAQTTVADARTSAAALVAEAEREAADLRAEAKRQIDELVQQRRTEVLSEVGTLEQTRDQLQADVSALEAHLDAQRANLRANLDALEQVLADPAALRMAPAPQLSGASSADLVEPDVVDDTVDLTDTQPVDAVELDLVDGADQSAEPDVVDVVDVVDVIEVDEVADAAAAAGGGVESSFAPEPAVDEARLLPVDDDADAAFPPVKVPELLVDEQQAVTADAAGEGVDLATDSLFEGGERQARDEGGAPTELFTPFSADREDDPLGKVDDEADAAMRAFFEADFDSDTEHKKSRWRR